MEKAAGGKGQAVMEIELVGAWLRQVVARASAMPVKVVGCAVGVGAWYGV